MGHRRNNGNRRGRAWRAAVLSLLALTASAAAADESSAAAAEPAPPVWTGSLGLSFLSTSGNSDAQSLGVTTSWERQPTPWGVELEAVVDRARSGEATTAERTYASARARRSLCERFELFIGASWERDRFAGFDSRSVFEAGGSWRALTRPAHKLTFDLGLTWTVQEPVAAETERSLGAVAGGVYTWKLSPSALFKQKLALFPDLESTADWRLRSETSLEASLAGSWALRLGYLLRYDHRPAPGFRSTDSTTTASLVWKR